MLIAQQKWMFAAIVCVAALAPSAAYAEGKNEIRAVAFSEDAGMTKVVVRGALTPTFTVYKLEKPSRVVIDVPQARLAEAMRGHEGASVFTPSTWAVSTIAAQELDDGGKLVRVIVTMARPGRYDVKTEGNDVVVMVTARDPKPAGANPEDILKAQRESEAAKQESANAKRDSENAKRDSETAKAESANAKRDSAAAKAEAERMKLLADQQAAAANAAKQDVARTKAEADRAKMDANAAKMDADRNKADAQRMRADAETARADAERMKSEAEKARTDAAKANDQATRAKLEAEAAAKTARADAAKAQAEAQRMKAEAAAAREEVEAAKQDVAMRRKEAEQAKAEAARVKDDAAKSSNEVARARTEAEAAKADAARARSEAKAAKADADAAKASAAADKRTAEADKQRAEQERAEAMKLQSDAKTKLAEIDKRAGAAQAMEDKARGSLAAAQAREEAARESVSKAARERVAAEDAADAAKAARDRAAAATAADKQKLIAEAKAAEDRLAAAKKAWDETEARRVAAETAANNAKADLDKTRTQLASVEGQRSAAEKAATEATRKRGEAEAAASDASRRRTEAESAAALASKQRTEAEKAAETASKQRSEAEQQRIAAEQMKKAAEQAARDAQVAKQAADKQRSVAEAAAKNAVSAKHDAEEGLETLMAKRAAAEKAANDLETRSKAEAKAQAAIAAAEQRKASDAEMQKFKADAQRLADDRKKAEDELADRRKAVASQQAEADRLKTAAAQARDSAEREEKRRNELAQQRAQEEQELADIKAQKAAASKMKPEPAPVVAAAPVVTKPAVKAAFIKDITFKGNDSSGRIALAMTGEGQISVGDVSSQYAELIIDNADLGQKLERKLDVSKFGSPVRSVASFRDPRAPNRVRLVVELASPATPTVERDATGVSWTFASTNTAQAKPRTAAPSPVVGGFGAASTPIAQQTVSQIAPQAPRHRKVYRGGTVDFDFKNAPMTDLLRTIAETGKVNIVVPDGIDVGVTVRLKKVPWDQALEVILASHGLWYRVDGNLYRIAPRKELDAEDEAENARREAMIKAEAPRTEVVPLNYASAADLKPKLEAMRSPKGSIEVDPRTNALIITDVAGNRDAISRLALQLDLQTPQISIEARIVEARSTFLRQFGIQWGGNATAAASGGNATGLVWPSSIGIAGGASDAQTPTAGLSALPSDFAVNLPAAVGTGEGGALGLSLGSVGGNFNINLRLSALEDTGTVRIISAPKITVLNNKEATISQGVSIPISVVSAAGTQTQFVQADLALKVTPYVSQRDCAIAMDLQVTKNEPDFVNVGARGDPSILRKEAKTSMLVQDGETSVLGGIYTRNTGLSYKKLPFLGDLPVIGWLFKSRRENDDRTEILVFITPKITNKGNLRCQQ